MNIFLLNILDTLSKADRKLLLLIQSLSSPALDHLMIFLRDPLTWAPLYALLLFWIVRNYPKHAWQFIVLSLVVFAITDFTSASVLKPLFLRPRPCAEMTLQDSVRDLTGCGGKYGMPSSHASNHFGLATFWYFTIKWMSTRKWWWLWIWAILVCYAQVYVGKHYPGDILVGAVLGTSVGFLLAAVFRKWLLKKDL